MHVFIAHCQTTSKGITPFSPPNIIFSERIYYIELAHYSESLLEFS